MIEDTYDCGNCILKNVRGKLWCNDECLKRTDKKKTDNMELSVWDFMGYDR